MFLLFLYLNIFKLIYLILLGSIFTYLIYILSVYFNIKQDELIIFCFFIPALALILFVIIRKIINKITKNIHYIFLKSINKKQININSKLTKT